MCGLFISKLLIYYTQELHAPDLLASERHWCQRMRFQHDEPEPHARLRRSCYPLASSFAPFSRAKHELNLLHVLLLLIARPEICWSLSTEQAFYGQSIACSAFKDLSTHLGSPMLLQIRTYRIRPCMSFFATQTPQKTSLSGLTDDSCRTWHLLATLHRASIPQ